MMRANALMAIAHGSAGLFWWWYGDGQKTIVSAGDVPEAWDSLTSVVQELRELRPLLVKSPKLPVRVTCDPEDAKVHAAAWQTDRGLLLIAVNPALKPAQAAVTVVGLPASAQAIVRGENRELPVQAGAVADSFDPLGAHVYIVAK